MGVGFGAQGIYVKEGGRTRWRDPLPCTPSRIPSSALAHEWGILRGAHAKSGYSKLRRTLESVHRFCA